MRYTVEENKKCTCAIVGAPPGDHCCKCNYFNFQTEGEGSEGSVAKRCGGTLQVSEGKSLTYMPGG